LKPLRGKERLRISCVPKTESKSSLGLSTRNELITSKVHYYAPADEDSSVLFVYYDVLGKRLIECILDENNKKWPKFLPRISDREVAAKVANLLLVGQFYHRSEKVGEKKSYLKISQNQEFDEKGYFTWMYAGNMMWSNIATGLVIAVVIGFTLLPVWPDVAKKVLWYLSVTFLIATFSFCIIRLLAFVILWIFGYEFWIFPRLFDESLSFQDSFKPFYTFEGASNGQGYYRLATLGIFLACGYWAATQPTEFDAFLKAQGEFVDDLYSGKLLSDVAFDPREHMQKQGRKGPSLEDLLKDLERDEISDKAEFSGTETETDSNIVDEAQQKKELNTDQQWNMGEDSMVEDLDRDIVIDIMD
jgi:translocation protein SEC62